MSFAWFLGHAVPSNYFCHLKIIFTNVLRYNLHTKYLTHFNVQIDVPVNGNYINDCNYHHIQILKSFQSPQKSSSPVLAVIALPPTPALGNKWSVITIVLLFLPFHINGIRQCAVFWVWLPWLILLKFILVIAYISMLLLFNCWVILHCMVGHISYIHSQVCGHFVLCLVYE